MERYRALIPSYVRGASIIFLLYDVSSRNSFTSLSSWINFIKQVNTDNSLMVLCGNKIDLPRKVSYKEGKEIADREKMPFYETSAKTGENVNKMMYTCISKLPFFSQFQVESPQQLIDELEKFNSNKNSGNKTNNQKEKNEAIVNNSFNNQQDKDGGIHGSTQVLTDNKNEKKKKKKCC